MTPSGQTSNGSEAKLTENPTIHTVFIIYVVLFSVVIFFGNSLTTLSILCFTKNKTTVGTIISCLCVVEVCNALGGHLVTVYAYFTHERLSRHSPLCEVQGYFSTAMRLSTISLVCLLCVDRTLASFARNFHQLKWRGTLFKIALSSICIFPAFAASWPLLGFGVFVPAAEAFSASCVFSYTDSFAIFATCFLWPQLVFIAVSSCVLIFKSPSKVETNSHARWGHFAKANNRLQNPARHLHQRTLARMCGLIAVLYFLCHFPWNVLVCLSLASVDYPEFLGLMCPTLTLVSGLFSPLICGLVWSPYRRAYIRVLCWPGYKCRATSRNGEDHATPLDTSTPGRSRTYSFWSADNFIDEDLHPPESAIDVLFGPTSLARPLEFNARELQMFEKHTVNPDTIIINVSDDVTCNDDVINKAKDVTRSNNATGSSDVRNQGDDVPEETIQFQSILNLIDELTDGKGTQKSTGSSAKVKRSRSNLSLLGGLIPFRSASPAPTPARSGLYLDDIGQYIKSETRVETAGKSGRSARASSKSPLPDEQFWLRRLGRSQDWGVDARPRYLDYLVAERVKEYTTASEQPFFIDI